MSGRLVMVEARELGMLERATVAEARAKLFQALAIGVVIGQQIALWLSIAILVR